MLEADRLVLVLALILSAVKGQTTHIVTVGVEGSFFSPPTVSARLNDIVSFVFGGDVHSVTQSTFAAPCVRLAGGFDSGIVGRGADFSKPPPIWNLLITNDSEPIWLFCEASIPTSHCESGMVGVINPPSIQMYNQFLSAAKLVTSTPKPSPAFLPSGQGAIATNSPMPSSIPISAPAPTSTPSPPPPTSTATTAPTSSASGPPALSATSHSSGTKNGIIAGCATVGGVILIVLVILFIIHHRRRKTHRAATTPTPTPREIGEPKFHRVDRSPEDITAAPTVGSPITTSHPFPFMSDSATIATSRYDDPEKTRLALHAPTSPTSSTRSIRPLPPTPSQSQLSQAGDDAHEEHQRHVDIDTLAMQVASVLLHTPPRPGSRQHINSLRDHPRYGSGSSEETQATAPPHYQSV